MRLDVIAGRRSVGDDLALRHGGEAVALRVREKAVNALELSGTDQRPAIQIGERRADFQRSEARAELREHFLVARLLDQEPAAGRTRLSGVLDDRVDDHRQRVIEIGVGEHDLRALAAQLQRHGAMPLRRLAARQTLRSAATP